MEKIIKECLTHNLRYQDKLNSHFQVNFKHRKYLNLNTSYELVEKEQGKFIIINLQCDEPCFMIMTLL